MSQIHEISFNTYSAEAIVEMAAAGNQLTLAPDVVAAIERCERFVAKKVSEGRHIYGVNAGFGSLCERRVSDDQMALLQYNHVVSHAAGVGETVDPAVVRIMMLVKILTFRWGTTGIALRTVERLLEFLNRDIVPVVPKKGTLGASGDLAPLSHMSLPLLGLGEVFVDGRITPADQVLAEHGWEPLTLGPKEGLALTNGVQYLNAIGIHVVARAGRLVRLADLIASLSAQAFSASRTSYDPVYHTTSLHPERLTVANNFTALLVDSNHHELPTAAISMQDPYSFRCIPQVHAAVRQAYEFAAQLLVKECNSVSDNPQFFPEHNKILFGGALHGESSAFAMDFLAIALSELGSISERRTYQMLSGTRGLPDFLVNEPGVNSGLMVVQYTAAALVNENKVFCTPASIDTIMSSQLQEDHVSMGGTSAYKLLNVIENLETIMAIELLTAVQAIDLNPKLKLASATRPIYDAVRARVPFIDKDRVMAGDIAQTRDVLLSEGPAWIAALRLG